MIKRNPLTTVLLIVFVIAIFDIMLLFSGQRILISEKRTAAPESDIYAPMQFDTLECTYFTGRSIKSFSKGPYELPPDECPFIYKP